MNSLIRVFRDLPRAARWALLGAVALVAYFGLIEPALDSLNDLNSRADAQRLALMELNTKSAADEQIGLGVRRFGRVLLPGDPQVRPVEFNRKVLAVLEKHGVRNHTNTTRTVPLGSGQLQSELGSGAQVQRLIREIQFEAAPEAVAGVIADLESTPEVASVSRVQLRRVEAEGVSRLLRATIAAEAWISLSKRGAR